MFGLTTQDIDLIKGVFQKFSSVEQVKIFGSRAIGNFKKGSDIDLVVYGPISDNELSQMKVQLENEIPLPYSFDLISFNEITHQALKDHIAQYGKVFFTHPNTSPQSLQ